MTKPRLRIGVSRYSADIAGQAGWAQEVEDLGFDMVSCGDTQNIKPDCFVTLTAMAMKTRRVRLGTLVSNPVTRHPAVAASALGALQELSDGRVFFGIGTGDSALITIGEKPAKMEALEEYCLTVKGLCAGEEVNYRGHRFKLEWPTRPVPLWVAAEGPRMKQLAGRIADGVIFANGISEDVVKDNLRAVHQSALEAGRAPAAIDNLFIVKPYFAESEEKAWSDLAWTLAASANHAFKFSFDGKFVPKELEPGLTRLMADYASHEHNMKSAGSHNAALVADNGLTGFLGHRFLLAGTPQHILQRLRDLEEWGVKTISCPLLFGDPAVYARRLAKEVLGPLRNG